MRSVGQSHCGNRPGDTDSLVAALTAAMESRLTGIDSPSPSELTIVSWMLSGELAAIRPECETGTSMELQPQVLDVLLRELDRINHPGRNLGAVAQIVAQLGAVGD
ncbi:hypothetical protein [Prescottella subtropica]|uniref:hypothetical protein n=1 Tax=Prescottella subtropica TaxID=2545757 RepID=UPI001387562A|nr:hypothetical protein [Prescottella subtropica]